MASCKLGHVYIIETAIAKPRKEKYAICVCVAENFFVWINSRPRPHGKDQLAIPAGCHELVKHDSFIDLSRVVVHTGWEFDAAQEFSQIGEPLCKMILAAIEAGLEVMPGRHCNAVAVSIATLI